MGSDSSDPDAGAVGTGPSATADEAVMLAVEPPRPKPPSPNTSALSWMSSASRINSQNISHNRRAPFPDLAGGAATPCLGQRPDSSSAGGSGPAGGIRGGSGAPSPADGASGGASCAAGRGAAGPGAPSGAAGSPPCRPTRP